MKVRQEAQATGSGDGHGCSVPSWHLNDGRQTVIENDAELNNRRGSRYRRVLTRGHAEN